MNNHRLHETRTAKNTSNEQEEMDKYCLSSWTLNKIKNTSYPRSAFVRNYFMKLCPAVIEYIKIQEKKMKLKKRLDIGY